ncbi:MAG: DUF4129 domain-containing protein [Anaerolineales bacterium]|nr:DUF4129 domain-containing protein [Anaerolineales bacterium]
MHPHPNRKTSLLVTGILALLAIAVLAASLDSLVLAPATPFSPAGERNETTLVPLRPPSGLFFWVVALIGITILTVGILVAMIFATPQQRRRMARALLLMTFFLILAALLISQDSEAEQAAGEAPVQPQAAATVIDPGSTGTEEAPLAFFEPPQVSPWISFGVSFGALVLLAGPLAWLLIRASKARRAPGPLEELREIAQTALDDLQAGVEWGDAVVACYASMTELLQEKRGLSRRAYMTPAEFAAGLTRARIPQPAVEHLTRLFERVRYGAGRSSPADGDAAAACLREIVTACLEEA